MFYDEYPVRNSAKRTPRAILVDKQRPLRLDTGIIKKFPQDITWKR